MLNTRKIKNIYKIGHKTNLSNEQKIRLYSVLQESEFVMNKSNKAEIDSLSIIKSKTKDTETLTNNSAKKLSNSCYVEPYKLKGVSSDSVLQTKPTIQQKLVIESFYSKTMLPLESKNNINKCSSKDLTFLKNKYINHCGSGSKSSSIKQFRLELLRDKKKIDKIVRKPVKAGVDSMDSKLFGPEIHESDDSVKNKNLEQSVSSDSDSENNNIHSTFLLKDDKIYPKIRQVERKSVQKLDCVDVIDKGLFSKQKLQKQKADVLKMKLFPVLSPLHKQILQWDINYNGEIPPGSNEQMYLEVEYTFQTSQAYVNTFEPLLLLECWQQIIKAKEENVDQSFKIKIINRTSVDEFIDLYVFVSYEIFYSVVISDSDILVISNSLKPLVDTNVISCLAKVQMVSKKKDSIEITLRTYPSNKMNTLLRPNNELYGLKLFSLVTIQREYSALKSLEYLELCNDIINAKSQPFPSISFNEVQRAMVAYDVNKPQAEAIIGVTKSTGFYLIQGPPGTGKTKTILGMINAFLSESKNKSARFGTIQNDCESSRILVCAPSNAAIDEIVLRLKQGFQDAKGIRYYPKIVRVGSNVAINLNVKDVSLDNLVEMELSKSNVKIEHDHQIANQEVLREQLNSILKQRDSLRKQLEDEMLEQKKKNLEVELKSLNLQKNNLGQQLDELRDQQSSVNKSLDIARHKIQIDILTNADIICSTLSASGYELFGNLAFDFSTVIIDEAAQCIELSTIIPLKYGCKRCILYLDPNQLPPTVFSQTAASYSYEQSLFVRMQKNCPSSVHMLSIQYRMHPSISQFPSKFFYSNRLVNGDDMEKKTKRPWHQIDLFGPYRFFDIHGYEDEAFCSPFNLMEARAALLIYDTIIQNFPSTNFNGYFGIITPYKQQLGKIKELFVGKYGESILKNIDFNTVDGFQGQEKDIIILSCVRSSVKGIGFLSDIRRMNVGLTRAKSSLIILGNVKTLSCHSYWRSLIEDAQRRNLLTKAGLMALKKNNDAYFHNSNITHDEKISDKSYPLQKNTEEDSYLKKGDFSQDLKVFENKKNEISSNFETSMETSSQVPFVIHKKRLAPDIFIRRPKIKK
ncbi:hypothetical protein PORY_001491 [Pneumocystis oryctolagi]|uniref:Uncharacterized protein n=1 Tax=Pneumocystis oryctolagi TaxID=42067 RepID=A0ACB7CCQ8_9ASCO|nr:hypothetical protein PORY_001491 [Pneumocystis oryctolagi]